MRETMLISFSINNFCVYRNQAEFTMVAGRMQADKETLISLPAGGNKKTLSAKVLPVTAIFGPNASGKSTFVRALDFLQNIVAGERLRHVPFALDETCRDMPTTFEINFATDEYCWCYRLGYDKQDVRTEILERFADGRWKPLFSNIQGATCIDNDFFAGSLDFTNTLAQNRPVGKTLLTTLLGFAEKLYKDLLPVKNWFYKVLCIITPDRQHQLLGRLLAENAEGYASALASAHTGISSLDPREIPFEQISDLIPREELEAFEKSPLNTMTTQLDAPIILQKDRNEAGRIKVYKYYAGHKTDQGDVVDFPFSMESAGTKRLLNLLPTLLPSDEEEHVYVIDELDNSLHTWLTRSIIRKQLSLVRSGRRQQMVFTTHDGLLLQGDLLRRDELWLIDRPAEGGARLVPFIHFEKATKDKRLLENYLEGRLGGLDDVDFEL